jgi:hypothetical protein
MDIAIWPGSSSFFPGDTPFGFYDHDVSFQTESNSKIGDWEDKRISLHTDELDIFFACLDHLKYF